MIERFQYHAFAVGLSGHITVPFDEIIPIQASAALPETGGFGTDCVRSFRFRNILSFSSAETVVAGSFDGKSHDALATVTIRDLDILGMVTASRMMARIASTHPVDNPGETVITPLGSHFENLRIAGYPVEVDLAVDTFNKFDTAGKVRAAYRENKDRFREEFGRLTLIGRGDEIPERIRCWFPWRHAAETEEIPENNGIIACSLVREIRGLGSELRPYGHVIHVPGFGTVRLAEFKITQSARRITMLQVDLGSTPKGRISGGGAEGNGSPW